MANQYNDGRTVREYEAKTWSSEKISRQHRQWGFNLPAFDIDFLLVEMHGGRPAALVEYKFMTQCGKVDIASPTFSALSILANAAAVPLLLVFYDFRPAWHFVVQPLNRHAYKLLGRIQPLLMSERAYVELLYRARGIVCPHQLLNTLDSYKPEVIP